MKREWSKYLDNKNWKIFLTKWNNLLLVGKVWAAAANNEVWEVTEALAMIVPGTSKSKEETSTCKL